MKGPQKPKEQASEQKEAYPAEVSRKCMSYYMMKRDPRKFKWTINKKEINR